MGITRKVTTVYEGRWPIKGLWPTLNELRNIVEEATDFEIPNECEFRFEPPGSTLVGAEPAMIVMKPFQAGPHEGRETTWA